MNTMIINSITIIFVIVTILYSIYYIVLNKLLYNFIKDGYSKLNQDYKNSDLYTNIKEKYNKYTLVNSHANLNITSFIEEVSTDFTFKNKRILERIKVIKNTSGTCILLGVLGTFIGLSMMLLSVNNSDIVYSLPKAISSMQTAFITSIVGIVCSLIINLSIGRYDCEYTLVQLMLKLENLITSEITHTKQLNSISRNLDDFNKEFINGINTLKEILDSYKLLVKSFDQNVKSLDKQFSILNVKFIELFYKYDNQENINKEILADIKEATKNIYESTESQYKIRDYIKNINQNQELILDSYKDILKVLLEDIKDLDLKEIEVDTYNDEEIYEIENLKDELFRLNGDDFIDD